MKDKENKLIAEFMGHKLGLDGDGLGTKRIEDTYNKSWDWLMPVIIKMADIREDTHYKLYKTIDEAYEEVVEFIKEQNDER